MFVSYKLPTKESSLYLFPFALGKRLELARAVVNGLKVKTALSSPTDILLNKGLVFLVLLGVLIGLDAIDFFDFDAYFIYIYVVFFAGF